MTNHDASSSRFSTEKLALLRTMHPARTSTNELAPRPKGCFVPASYQQQSLWFLNRLLEPAERSAYHVPLAFWLRTAVDTSALQSALTEIVRRHEVLRTTFVDGDYGLEQVIHNESFINLRVVEAAADGVDSLLAAEVARPFELEEGPLLRALLIRCADDQQLLVFTLHHAVFDGWSSAVLTNEISELYAAFSDGTPSPLPELNLQYGDYAVAQRGRLADSSLTSGLEYWHQQLKDAPALLDLPTDRPRPLVASYAGGRCDIVVPAGLTAGLRDLASSTKSSLYMVILTAYQALLARWSGQTDICVGSPIAGRAQSSLGGLIGFFVNTIVLRTDLSDEPTFLTALQRTRATMLEGYKNQDVPFELLVEQLKPVRSSGHNPLFQTACMLQHRQVGGGLRLNGIEAEGLDFDSGEVKGDLLIDLEEQGDELVGAIGYRTDLFDAQTIERLATAFLQLLQLVVDAPDTSVSALDIFTSGELQTLQAARNDTTLDVPDTTLTAMFEAWASSTPNAPAVLFDEETITFGALNATAIRLGRILAKAGAEPGQVVAIMMGRSPDLLVAQLAVLKAGACFLPLDPAIPAARISSLLEDAKPVIVVADRVNYTKLLAELHPTRGVELLCYEGLNSAFDDTTNLQTSNLELTARPNDLAYVIATSGSTGRPKCVEIPHRAIVNQLSYLRHDLDVKPRDVMLAWLSVGFDASIEELWLPLVSGAAVCLAPQSAVGDPAALLAHAAANDATLVMLGPSMLAVVPDETERGCIRHVITGGEPLPAPVAERITELWGIPITNQYGPTETTISVTSARYDRDSHVDRVGIGLPVWNTTVHLLDNHMHPVLDGASADLYVGGAQLGRGYLGDPTSTADRYVPSPFGPPGARIYRTGDTCRWRNGELDFVGRDDGQVKIRGLRIELGDVTAALKRHPAVQQAAAVVRSDRSDSSDQLVAYLVVSPGSQAPSRKDMDTWLRRTLPVYMLPAAFVWLAELPSSINGKLDARALPPPPLEQATYEAPATPAEIVLAEIFAEVLKLEVVGVNDDFFDLGGNSLTATRLVGHIRSRLHIEIPVRAIFVAPTIRGIAIELALLDCTDIKRGPVLAGLDRSRYVR